MILMCKNFGFHWSTQTGIISGEYIGKKRIQMHVRENWRGNHEWIIQRIRGYLYTLFVFAWYSGIQYILCCVFCFVCLRLVYPMLSVTLDRPFLIATSVFSNVYFILLKYRYLNSSTDRTRCNAIEAIE
jgi:hypothetical protein